MSWNASDACRKSGYVGNVDVTGARLLVNASIRAAIQERMAELAMPASEVLSRLGQMARANISDFILVDDFGSVTGLNAKHLKEYGHLVKRLKVDPDKIDIELYDGQAALVQMGKHYQLFTEKIDILSGGEKIGPASIVIRGFDGNK